MKKKLKDFPSHAEDMGRLNRIIGQLEGVKRMIENKRYCMDILMQTRAVASAIRSLESSILKRHLGHCVLKAFKSGDKSNESDKIAEIMELFKRCSVS